MVLAGKKILVTGVLTPQSIAFGVAQLAQQQGAQVMLTSFGRAMSLTQRTAKRLPQPAEVLELDVTNPAHFPVLADRIRAQWGGLDGALHAVAFAPEDALGGKFLTAPWESVAQAFRVSTFSFKELAVALAPLMPSGGSLVTLDFDNSTQAWPLYDWMGVCKAGLESTVRYLARDLGPKRIRVNAVAAGPIATIAAKGIPGFKHLEDHWGKQAPLGWDARDEASTAAVARAVCVFLSDWIPLTTGEVLRVDGGFHAMGASPVALPPASDPAT